jgi:hypothetical protein
LFGGKRDERVCVIIIEDRAGGCVKCTLAAGVVRVKEQARTAGNVFVTETRNFAGKEMEVTKTYAEGSRVGMMM